MTKYITGQEIITDLGLRPVELFEDYVSKGFQPYDRHGKPFTPSDVISWRYNLDRQRAELVKLYNLLDEHDDDEDKAHFYERRIVPAVANIQNSEARIQSFQGIGWTDLELPPYPQEADYILNVLANAYFLRAELYRMLNPNHAHIDLDPAEDPPPLPAGKKIQKERPVQRHRRQCREVAKKIWTEDPDITIADLIVSDEITLVFQDRKEPYTEDTLRNWVKDLCPNREPGRRPKKSKK